MKNFKGHITPIYQISNLTDKARKWKLESNTTYRIEPYLGDRIYDKYHLIEVDVQKEIIGIYPAIAHYEDLRTHFDSGNLKITQFGL